MGTHDEEQALQRRLERLQAALGPRKEQRALARQERKLARRSGSGRAYSTLAVAVGFIAVAIATGNHGLLVPGIILAIVGSIRTLRAVLAPAADAAHPVIGMGATIAANAVIEPGAVVEMGADVEAGAIVRRGAVVRMGCTIHAGAVIEEGAIIGWGCDIEAGAVVGAGAIIGAGSTVNAGAHVAPHLRLSPGSTISKSPGEVVGAPMAAGSVAPPVVDARRERVEAACARIEVELGQVPETYREHLGATAETATALRQTCLELLTREKALRAEASDEALKFLDTEREELERRAAAATDPQVQRSLQSAVAAIDDQKKQRLGLRQHADRLEAELTRLQWTLEGMATQLVRLRTAGVEAGKAPSGEVLQTVQQLHAEIDAIADALEEVSAGDAARLQPVAPISSDDPGLASRPDRVR